MAKSVTIDLTDEQEGDLEDIMREASAAYDAGEMGAVIAQVFGSHMKVGFIPNKYAARIRDILLELKAEKAAAP